MVVDAGWHSLTRWKATSEAAMGEDKECFVLILEGKLPDNTHSSLACETWEVYSPK